MTSINHQSIMDEELILHEIVKSLAFEIEAVNQDNVLKWTTTNGTPLNVKVRVRNKDEPRLIQRGAIPVPRIGITAPEKLRLISSDQTILSFNVYLESGLEKESKRDNGFKKFNIGSCLGTYSDDEGPYLPSSSEQNALVVDSDVKCQPNDSKVESDVFKNNVSQPVLNSINTVPQRQKTFFGKCKPGGCLDPPFGEDSYAYSRTNADRVENIHLKLNKLADNKETVEPGGCLDPPFSEDVYPYTKPRTEQQDENELKSQFIKDHKQGLSKKSSEERDQYKAQDKKTIKGEDDSKNIKDIYARTSKENLLKSKYSNSLITYPTDVSSSDTLHDQIPNKKVSIKSNDDEIHKQSYDYPVSYFVPPKDVMRHKDEDGRYSRRLSSDTVYSSNKGPGNDERDKSKMFEHENISRNALPTNVIYEHDPKPNSADDASKNYRTEKEVVAVEQENPGPDTVKIPSHIRPSIDNDKDRASSDLKPIESNSNNEENQHSKLQSKIGSPADNDISKYEKTVENRQTSPFIPMFKGADRDTKYVLPQSEDTHTTGAQTASRLGTQREKPDSESITKINEEYSQFQTQSNSRNHLSADNNDDISKKIAIAGATIPILATATLALSEKQSIKCNENEMNQSKPKKNGLDSSMIEENKSTVYNIISEDPKKIISNQKLQNKPMLSPECISSSENNEFDVSSEHSIDSKHDLLNVKPHKPAATFTNRDKQDILSDSLNLKRNENVIISNKMSKESYKDPEHQKTRTSEILQKKPFTARHDLDIERDDIDKTAPSKRKTFKVIASDNSIQKSTDNDELPDVITDVPLKTTNISQLNSPDSTKNTTVISDTNNKTQDIKNNASQINVRGETKDLPSKVSDSQVFTTPTKLDEKPKEVESTLNTNFDKNLSNILSQNVTDLSPTINQTNALVSSQNENQVNSYPLHNLVPKHVKDIELNVVDDRKSVVSSIENYKGVQSPKSEIIQGYTLDKGKENTLATRNQFMDNMLLGEFSKHSLQTTISDYTKDLHTKVSVSDKAAVNQTEIVYTDKKESGKILNIASDKSVQNNHIENLLSNSIADDIYITDSTKEHMPQNEEMHLNDNTTSFPESLEKLEFIGIQDGKIKNIDRSHSSDNTIDAPLKLVSNDLQSDNNKYYDNSKIDPIDFLGKYDNLEDDATQVVMPQTAQDFGSAINNKTNAKTVHIKDLDYKELADAVHDELSTNILPTISPNNEDNMNAETADDRNSANINQLYNEHGFYDTHRNDYPEEIELPQDISEVPRSKNALYVETEKDIKNSIHSGRYSDLISGVLSNISENKEGEESNTKQNTAPEDTIERREDIVKLYNKTALGHEELNTERGSISKKSESIMADHTYDVNDGSYEMDSAQLNMSKEVVFRDITNDFNDHPMEYGTSQITSSVNELLGLKTKSSRVKRFSPTGQSTHYKQPTNIATESTPLKKDSPLYLDMSFCSYVNDNKQRVVQTQNPLFKQQTPNDGTITTLKTLIRHGNEIRIPVDNVNDITLNILDKDVRVEIRNNVGLPTSHTRREKHFGDRTKKQNEILNKNLSLIYQSKLIPLHTVIKDLTQEVNTLAKKQEILQMRILNTKRTKSLRLIPVVKRCGCRRV